MRLLAQEVPAYESVPGGGVFRFRLLVDRPPRRPVPGATCGPGGPCGLLAMTVTWPGTDLPAAVAEAVRRIEEHGGAVWRVLADDYVTQAEVGRRLGCSRETVRRWAAGGGPPGFPPPVTLEATLAYYSWGEVVRWLGDWPAGEPAPEVDRAATALAAIDLALRLRRLAGGLADPHPVWALLLPA